MEEYKEKLAKILKRNPNWKTFLGIVFVLSVLIYSIFGHDILYFFSLLAEVLRTVGVILLLAKILREKKVSGLSLKTQELFVVVFVTRFCFKVFFEKDILYPMVEGIATASTIYIVYLMRGPMAATYSKSLDTFRIEFIVVPCLLLSLVLHPKVTNWVVTDILWSFSTFLEALTLLPQLFLIQRTGECESFTAHYMVCLGLSRFLECFFWITAFLFLGYSFLYTSIGGYVICSELVHTVLLADFYYYYYVSWKKGIKMTLPARGLV